MVRFQSKDGLNGAFSSLVGPVLRFDAETATSLRINAEALLSSVPTFRWMRRSRRKYPLTRKRTRCCVKVLSPCSIVGFWDIGRITGQRFNRGRMIQPDALSAALLLVEIQPSRSVGQDRAPTENKLQILGKLRLMVGAANGCS